MLSCMHSSWAPTPFEAGAFHFKAFAKQCFRSVLIIFKMSLKTRMLNNQFIQLSDMKIYQEIEISNSYSNT